MACSLAARAFQLSAVATVTMAASWVPSKAWAEPPPPPPSAAASALPGTPPVPSAATSTVPSSALSLSPPVAATAQPEPTIAAPKPVEGTKDRGPVTMMMAGFGVAAGGFLIGAISGGVALSKTHQLNRDCGGTVCPASKQSDIDSAKSWAGFSTVSFAVAAIGAVVGFNGYLLGNDSKPTQSSARVQVKPILGFGAAGLEGSF